jgi:hypothetical protein
MSVMSDPINKFIFKHRSDTKLALEAKESHEELKATATRRLGLLRRVNTVRVYAEKPCPVCLKKPKRKLIGDSISPVDNHADGCKLAEELEGE